jgi:hypothetical protein
MSERLTYEMQLQQQWIDLPLPDENLAWADMRRRLEEDDDHPVIAWWRRGCVLWGALLLTMLAIGWYWFRPDKWFDKTSGSQQEIHKEQRKDQQQPPVEDKSSGHKDNSGSNETNTIDRSGNNTPGDQDNTTVTNSDTDTRTSSINDVPGKNRNKESSSKPSGTDMKNNITANTPRSTRTSAAASYSVGSGGGRQTIRSNRHSPVPTGDGKHQPSVPIVSDSPASDIINSGAVDRTVKKDPAVDTIRFLDSAVVKKDSVRKKEPTPEKKPEQTAKTDSSKKKKIFFSAGIGEHQQIPLAGQKFTPYSSSGRKSSLADYIPSVYFRVNKEDKWFIQGEFRYGAPQYTKEIQYRNFTKVDTIGQTAYNVKTLATVKKTFYHQLPVTFNYYVLPDWSVGAGMAWNMFSSAVSDKSLTILSNATQQDSVISSGITRAGRDSVFSNSYFQAVLETQYKWKRFSFGARYMAGLQPYIKFNLPGGAKQEEKNSSLHIFIRYELWKSKKK